MMQTREKQSTDWVAVRDEYRQNAGSVRSLARQFNVSDTAIRKRARAEKWVRAATVDGSREPGKPNSWRLLTGRLDAIAVALSATFEGMPEDSRAGDRRYVAAMVCLGAAHASIAAALGVTEQNLRDEFGREIEAAAQCR
jgi:hypothetical protein